MKKTKKSFKERFWGRSDDGFGYHDEFGTPSGIFQWSLMIIMIACLIFLFVHGLIHPYYVK